MRKIFIFMFLAVLLAGCTNSNEREVQKLCALLHLDTLNVEVLDDECEQRQMEQFDCQINLSLGKGIEKAQNLPRFVESSQIKKDDLIQEINQYHASVFELKDKFEYFRRYYSYHGVFYKIQEDVDQLVEEYYSEFAYVYTLYREDDTQNLEPMVEQCRSDLVILREMALRLYRILK